MKFIHHLNYILIIMLFCACGSYPVKNQNNESTSNEEPVVIANEELQYEIIIIDPGFTTYLNTVARPEEYYSQTFLEAKNRIYVVVWNNRARNPLSYNNTIYENIIDYDPNINYGLEVNYKLYWYFKFAEQKYGMSLNF